jgi:hypothetical protein
MGVSGPMICCQLIQQISSHLTRRVGDRIQNRHAILKVRSLPLRDAECPSISLLTMLVAEKIDGAGGVTI